MSRPCDAVFFTASIDIPHSYRSNRADSCSALVSSLILPHGLNWPSICSVVRRQSGSRVDEGLGCPHAQLADPTDHKTHLWSQIYVYKHSTKQARFCHLSSPQYRVSQRTGIEGSAGRVATAKPLSVAAVCTRNPVPYSRAFGMDLQILASSSSTVLSSMHPLLAYS